MFILNIIHKIDKIFYDIGRKPKTLVCCMLYICFNDCDNKVKIKTWSWSGDFLCPRVSSGAFIILIAPHTPAQPFECVYLQLSNKTGDLVIIDNFLLWTDERGGLEDVGLSLLEITNNYTFSELVIEIAFCSNV